MKDLSIKDFSDLIYDKLDILEKLYINRIYADLSNGF